MAKISVLDWLAHLDVHAAHALTLIEPTLSLFPCERNGIYHRIQARINLNTRRYASLHLAVRKDTKHMDLLTTDPRQVQSFFSDMTSVADASAHALAIDEFARFNRRIEALSMAAQVMEVSKDIRKVIPAWLDSLQDYGLKCRQPISDAFDRYIELSNELDDAMFNFNTAVGRVRFRAMRCTYTLDDNDPLGPSDPQIKVITSIDRSTGRRRYNRMQDFKGQLRKRRVVKSLTADLGHKPTESEIKAALKKQRNRKPNEWVTKDVIKACYLGRKSTDIFEAQAHLADVMEPWSELRLKLQALLGHKGGE